MGFEDGRAGETRTRYQLLRRQLLCPNELQLYSLAAAGRLELPQAASKAAVLATTQSRKKMAETGGFGPPDQHMPANSLARSRFRPLSQVSNTTRWSHGPDSNWRELCSFPLTRRAQSGGLCDRGF